MPLDGALQSVLLRKPITVPQGLVAYWPFDLASLDFSKGIAYDRSGHGYNGTLTNFTTAALRPSRISQLLAFLASSSQNVLTTLTWNTATPMSVSMWVNQPSGSTGTIISFGSAASPRIIAQVYIDNNLYWDFDNQSGGRISTSFSSYLGKDIHLGLFNNGVGSKGIYINGRLITSNATSNGGTNTLGALDIGKFDFGGNYLTMNAWQLRFYNRVLSAQEFLNIYQAGLSGRA